MANEPNTTPATSSPASPPAAPPTPAVPQEPHALSHLSVPFQAVDYTQRGYHFDASIAPGEVASAAEQMDQIGFALDTITGVDWLAANEMEIVYDFFHPVRNFRAVIRTRVPRENSILPTISNVFPGANWHERETHDFFGIQFQGHPDLSPFLLPEDATYHPLKKDFVS